MTFHAYRRTAFDHTHENKAFDKLYELLKAQWAELDEPLHLFGNFYVDGCEIDALVIKRNAFIVIDFKDYGGVLSFSENSRWHIDGVEVRGGSKISPLYQIKANKYSLRDYLRKCNFRSSPDLYHIAGLCLFHQPIKFDENQLHPDISRWFHIAEIDKSVRMIEAIVSNKINLPDTDLEMLLKKLEVPSYFPDGHAIEVPFNVIEGEPKEEPVLNVEQSKALAAIDDWLGDTKSKVFSLSGAFYTGTDKLLKAATQKIVKRGRSPVYLAPNSHVASLYKQQGLDDTHSIYSWLYAGSSSFNKDKDKEIYPVKKDLCIDEEKEILVFLCSHLIGDGHVEFETKIYGTGNIIQDLLGVLLNEKTEPDNTKLSPELKVLPKFLLIGDPYQLTRGAKDKSLLRCQMFEARNIPYQGIELNAQERDTEAPIERLNFQKTLIEQMQAEKFTQLPICEEGVIRTIKKGESRNEIAHDLLKWPRQSVYLCAKNDTAHSVNKAFRGKYLNTENDRLLVAGDIVELRNQTPNLNDDPLDSSESGWVKAPRFGHVVSANKEIETIEVILKGRETSVSVLLAKAKIKFGNKEADIRYLPDYLSAPTPELMPDQEVALKVSVSMDVDKKLRDEKEQLNKLKDKDKESYDTAIKIFNEKRNKCIMGSDILNAARLRFGYSITVHRAQGYDELPKVILDGSRAHDTENPATDSYFRWLYTATVCTSNSLHIIDYPILTPLSKATWIFSDARIGPVNFKPVLYYQQSRLPSKEEIAVPMPNGFSNADPILVALLLTIYDLIKESSWHVDTITQYSYLERYLFTCDQGKVELDLRYNGKYEVYIGGAKVIDEGPPELAGQIKELLYTLPIYKEKSIEEGVTQFQSHIARQDWSIISMDEKPYKAYVIAKNDIGRVKIELILPTSVSKKGMISSIKVIEADSQEVLDKFEKNFQYE